MFHIILPLSRLKLVRIAHIGLAHGLALRVDVIGITKDKKCATALTAFRSLYADVESPEGHSKFTINYQSI
jgi:hypothetical protein